MRATRKIKQNTAAPPREDHGKSGDKFSKALRRQAARLADRQAGFDSTESGFKKPGSNKK